MNNNLVVVEGKVRIRELNDLLGLHMNDSDVNIIGGWILIEIMIYRQEKRYVEPFFLLVVV